MSSRFQRADLISTIVIVGFFVSVCFHYVLHFYLHRDYPYSTFLFQPSDRLEDYINVVASARKLDPYRYHEGAFGNYFPVTYVFALIFGALHKPGLLLFLILSLTATVAYFYNQSGIAADSTINRLSKMRFTFVLTVMSYPLLFELDRANFESLTFLLIAACVLLIGRGRLGLSAAALALAIAMKGYPVIFVGLYLPSRHYREGTAAIILSIAMCVVCFSALHGGLAENIHSFAKDLQAFQNDYVILGAGNAGARLNTSLFAPLGLWNHSPIFIKKALFIYNGFALFCAAGLAWLITAKRTAHRIEEWKLQYLLAAAALLLPFISYDYKLLLLFIPLASFLNSSRPIAWEGFYCASFGAMLIPKDYHFLGNGVSISSVLEPLILIVTVIVIVRDVLAKDAGAELKDAGAELGEITHEEGKISPHGDSGPLGHNPLVS